MTALQVIEIYAGTGPDGQPVAEKIQVKVNEDNSCQLVRSPAFAKGIASGDIIKFLNDSREFEIVKHSGNLCVRVFSRDEIKPLAEELIPEFEKLGAELDIETPRMMVFSIHVSCGFQAIEDTLNRHVGLDDNSGWLYGNVYDPKDGQKPLNWWQEILKPE